MPKLRSGCTVGKLDVPVWTYPASAGASDRSGPFREIRSNMVGVSGRMGNHIGKQLAREALRYDIYVLRFYFIDSTIEADPNARPIK